MKKIQFEVDIEPMGKERPRATRGGHVYTPSKTVKAERAIEAAYREQVGDWKYPDKLPLKIIVSAYFKIPESDSKKVKLKKLDGLLRPTKVPDCDNVLKLVCDALNNVAYKDDSQIVSAKVNKYYGYPPRLWISIEDEAV